MQTSLHLADLLQQLMRRPNYHYTAGLVSKLSGIPRATIVNWLDGQVRKPQRWQDLIRVADALRLNVAETTQLLQVAGYPSIEALLVRVDNARDRALLAAWTTADGPAPSVPKIARRAHLPLPPDTFVGRTAELAILQAMLRRPHVRLLTLTGPGGSGKTRLALHLADGESRTFAHGVCFVSLATIRDPTLVAATIGRALGVAELDGQPPLASLQEELRDKQMLLVLDNFEHIAAAAPLVADLVVAAPQLKVLVTSRLALRLRGEHVFPVPPLELPRRTFAESRQRACGGDQVAELSQCSSVALFVQRAHAANPDFSLTSANASAIAAICVRLDGLPLAIELAAAHSKVLDPPALLERLEDVRGGKLLRLLTRGAHDLPARQQTLHATLTWSYDLLDAATQRLFRRLGVFAGGGTLEAAEAVCGDWRLEIRDYGDQSPISNLQSLILDGLETLVDHNLLLSQTAADGGRRFVMLETIREYALDRLAADSELDALRERHAAYYLALAETAQSQLQGPRHVDWLTHLEAEHVNLRAALEWFATVDAVSGLRLANALREFWWIRCHLMEGRAWLERMLAQVAEPTLLRASALSGAGMLAYRQGDYASAHAFHMESLAIWRTFDDRPGIATALEALGHVAIHRGDYALAQTFFEQGLALRQEIGDRHKLAGAYRALGLVAAHQCDYDRALRLYGESLVIVRELDDQHGIAIALSSLGDILRCRGEYTQAAWLYHESLPLFRALGDQHGIAWGLHNLGQVALYEGDILMAARRFKESLALCRDLGAKVGVAYGIAGIAGVAIAQGQVWRSVRLLGAVEALLDTIRGRMNAADRLAYERNVAAVRARLEPRAFEAGWKQGRALTIACAIEEALGHSNV